jgi:predicted dinucleotide-binding enzyme
VNQKTPKKEHLMARISIIGSGNMARAIGSRAVAGGNTVEIIGRNPDKSAALARVLGGDTTTGTWGTRPTGDIVILAVLFAGAVPVVRDFGEALAGKIVVDITNPFTPDATGLAVPAGSSVATQIAEAAPESTHVIKAFNTLFSHVLASGNPVDVFLAGDDPKAKQSLAAFITSLGLRPRDAGDLSMAHWLESASLLEMGLARTGLGFNIALAVDTRVAA